MESGRVGRRVEVSKRWQTKLRRPKVYLKFGCAKSIVRLVTSSLVLRRSIPAGLKFKGWYSILHKLTERQTGTGPTKTRADERIARVETEGGLERERDSEMES